MLASELLLVAALACLTVMVLLSVWKERKLREKLPPGPTPLPFIGNYLQLDMQQPYNSIMKISERYGPVFTIYLGPRRVVMLRGYEAVKRALVDQAEAFSGRGTQTTFDRIYKGYGLGTSNGETFKQLKRFTVATMGNLSLKIQECVQEEAAFLKEALRDSRGTFIDPTKYLSKVSYSVVLYILFGERFSDKDSDLHFLRRCIQETFQFSRTHMGKLHEMFHSVMNHLPGPQQKAFKALQRIEDFVTKKVEHHQRTLDPSSSWCFTDSFLMRMQEEEHSTVFCMKHLVMTIVSFHLGAMESVVNTLNLGLLLLVQHPDVQANIHKEIDLVIGRDRQPRFHDRVKMPYTEAVINEFQRIADIIPLGAIHRVTKDTVFEGYFIPKGTEVFPMLGSVLKDPKFFPNPEDFNPQHFLDEQGNFKRNAAFVPFSMGARACVGEAVARMELFLFLATIMQNFCLKSPQTQQDNHSGFYKSFPKYTLGFAPR